MTDLDRAVPERARIWREMTAASMLNSVKGHLETDLTERDRTIISSILSNALKIGTPASDHITIRWSRHAEQRFLSRVSADEANIDAATELIQTAIINNDGIGAQAPAWYGSAQYPSLYFETPFLDKTVCFILRPDHNRFSYRFVVVTVVTKLWWHEDEWYLQSQDELRELGVIE